MSDHTYNLGPPNADGMYDGPIVAVVQGPYEAAAALMCIGCSHRHVIRVEAGETACMVFVGDSLAITLRWDQAIRLQSLLDSTLVDRDLTLNERFEDDRIDEEYDGEEPF